MTKRTNKTDHVLNLLAGAGKKEEGHETDTAVKKKSQPPVDPFEQQKSNVSIMHTSKAEEDPIADSIRDSLEKEMNEAETTRGRVVKQEESVKREDVQAEPVREEAVQEELVKEEDVQEKPVKEEDVQEEPVKEEAVQEEPAREEAVQEEPMKEETMQETLPVDPKEEWDFEFVNVMERLVRDKVQGYMEQFGNCTCDRCIEDTVALSLTHLPAKCVVVNKAAVSPLINFYTNKYAGQITVEITKACITVQNNPHH